jgi:hypothetical protein
LRDISLIRTSSPLVLGLSGPAIPAAALLEPSFLPIISASLRRLTAVVLAASTFPGILAEIFRTPAVRPSARLVMTARLMSLLFIQIALPVPLLASIIKSFLVIISTASAFSIFPRIMGRIVILAPGRPIVAAPAWFVIAALLIPKFLMLILLMLLVPALLSPASLSP